MMSRNSVVCGSCLVPNSLSYRREPPECHVCRRKSTNPKFLKSTFCRQMYDFFPENPRRWAAWTLANKIWNPVFFWSSCQTTVPVCVHPRSYHASPVCLVGQTNSSRLKFETRPWFSIFLVMNSDEVVTPRVAWGTKESSPSSQSIQLNNRKVGLYHAYESTCTTSKKVICARKSVLYLRDLLGGADWLIFTLQIIAWYV